jgi:hypothetical protein
MTEKCNSLGEELAAIPENYTDISFKNGNPAVEGKRGW